MRSKRSRPSPAIIVAALALVLALAGTAIAAPDFSAKAVSKSKVKKIAKKQANKQIKIKAPGLSVNHANTADSARPTGPAGGDLAGDYPDPVIGPQKVTTDKIADAAVTTPKIADAAVTKPKIADTAVGAAALGNTTQTVSASATVLANNNGFTSVQCPAGSQVLSGGGGASSFGVFAVESFQSGNGWLWAAHNDTAANQTIFATAVCLLP